MNWINENADTFKKLKGKTINGFSGIEMAFTESDPPLRPVFDIVGIPCFQFFILNIEVKDSDVFYIGTYQNGGDWGLYTSIKPAPCFLPDEECGEFSIYRNMRAADFETGLVNDVTISFSAVGDIDEVRIYLDETTLILKAAEFYEHNDETVHCNLHDESVILFKSEEEYENFRFGIEHKYPIFNRNKKKD